MITATQTKMARAALGWSADDLADRAGIGINTVLRFETNKQVPRRATLAVIRQAFENAGIQFIGADGVRMRGM